VAVFLLRQVQRGEDHRFGRRVPLAQGGDLLLGVGGEFE
jgi:hypothetical protein